ncbi:MAG: GerAB/ArcD/ProY family transporter [Ruminococcus sp.]|jgi:spore germination protein KB
MFADNKRISRRQLGRQLLLGLSGIFLLTLPGIPELSGWSGILGCLLGLVFLWLYLFFMMRKTAVRGLKEKLPSSVYGIVLFVLMSYLILSGGFMVRNISDMVSFSLLSDSRPWVIGILFLAASLLGTGREIQRRGRLGEVACVPVIGGLLIFLAAAAFQIDEVNLTEFAAPAFGEILKGAYYIFCSFSIVGLLPFMMHRVERPQGSLPKLLTATGMAAFLVLSCLVVIQLLFGEKGAGAKKIPLTALMSSVNFPGDFLDRFDALWMVFLIFALLYSVGTVLFYGQCLISENPGIIHGWLLAAAVFVAAFFSWKGRTVVDIYPMSVRYVYMPLFVVFGLFSGKIRRKI